MKKIFLAALSVFMILALTACGGDGGSQPTFVTTILSDPVFDGEIQKDSVTGTVIINQGNTESVFAGLDQAGRVETRAFLDFHLTGANGVPGNAIIDSAILDIVINSITPQPLIGTIPVRVDLISFQPPNLIGTNFDRILRPSDFDRTLQPALATTTVIPPISQADFGKHVAIDVTRLMVEAQRLGLVDFQIRILEDLGIVTPGLIEINDTSGVNRKVLAPLLQVTYF